MYRTPPRAGGTDRRFGGQQLVFVSRRVRGRACDRAARQNSVVEDAPLPNIILVSIDTLRADHLGCYGYFRETSPNIDAFAAEAVLFERAYSAMATTLPSHLTMLIGMHPIEHGVVANIDDGGVAFTSGPGLRSVAEVARDNGYATAGFVSATPLKRISGIHVGFETFDEPQGATRDAKTVTDAALSWLGQHYDEPFFLFVHYYDPHVPYAPPSPYREMFQTDNELEGLHYRAGHSRCSCTRNLQRGA